MPNDIRHKSDIITMVNTFYEKVRLDEELGPIFNEAIKDKWPAHLEKMYRFWQTVLLEEHTYYGSPFLPHVKLPIEPRHFERWTGLFEQTINDLFTGKKADEALWRAKRMAEMFQFKLDALRKSKNKGKPLI